MADNNYAQNGFRNDLKDKDDVLHQPDADRSAWELKVLGYNETIDVLNGDLKVEPEFSFSDEILNKIIEDKVELKPDDDIQNIIKDKDQQILLARYNQDQSLNETISTTDDDAQQGSYK